MAEKRMFSMKICDSDAFLDMPLSTQCLYFHLNMRADDDGFVGNPRRIQKLVGTSEDDLKLLIMKKFLLIFENGVIVIKHWKMHNTIQNDRRKETSYQDELMQLTVKKDKSYTFAKSEEIESETICIQNASIDLGLDLDLGLEIVKDVVGKSRFTPPTLKEVESYIKAQKYDMDASRFVDFYQSKGWMVGKNKMKDWEAAVRNWSKDKPKTKGRVELVTHYPTMETSDFDEDALNKALKNLGGS